MMKVSTSSAKNGTGRSISEAVWLSLLGFAANSAAQAKSADAPEGASRAAAPLSAEGVAAAALQDAGQGALAAQGELAGEADLAAQDLAGEQLFADADGEHLSAIIDQYIADDASSQAFDSSSEAAEEVADLMPKAGAFDKLAQGQSYKLAQAGNAGVAAPAMDAPSFDPSMLALLGLGGVALVAAAGGGSGGGAAPAPTPVNVGGVAVDGYLSGSTAFYDANGNGELDAGEAHAITDESGNFELTGVTQTANGRLVIQGGKDILTGKEFTGQLVSNSNAVTGVVVSPITSLLASGISPEALKAALGLPAGVDLASFDPVAALNSGDPALAQLGESVLMVAQQVFTVMSTLVAQGADPAAAAQSLAGKLSASGASLTSAVNGLVDADTATALNNINASIAENLGGGNLAEAFASGSAADLTQIMKSVVVAQTSFIDDVEGGADLADKYSGESLAAQVDDAQVELSTEMLSFLSEGGFDLAGAEFDPATISQDIADAMGELYPDVELDDLGLEVIGCL